MLFVNTYLDTAPADYLLFVDRQPVGVIEAKPDNTILTFVEEQTERYARSTLKWRVRAERQVTNSKEKKRSNSHPSPSTGSGRTG